MRCSFAQAGWTALHWAVFDGHHSIVGMLIAAGADTHSKDKVSDALPPSFPLPQSTVGPQTLGRQAHASSMQLNSRPVCAVCGAVVGHPFAVHET